MLEIMVTRIRQVEQINEIVIATTTSPLDDLIEAEAKKIGVGVYRGSEHDVLGRVVEAGRDSNAQILIELTGDCPLIDPLLIEECLQKFLDGNYDFVTNAKTRSYPDGMDVQVIAFPMLEMAAQLTTTDLDREHVSLFLRNNSNLFKTHEIISPPETWNPELGLTLDEEEDFILIGEIIKYFAPRTDYTCLEILKFLSSNPALIQLNSHVLRKGDS
jgi:spore coat polysaccharide biosynthesis protein SpsF